MSPELDVYPVNVTGLGQRLNKGRAIVVDGHLYVFNQQRQLVFEASDVTVQARRGGVYAITSGENTYEATRVSYGCGCNRKNPVYATSVEDMLALVSA